MCQMTSRKPSPKIGVSLPCVHGRHEACVMSACTCRCHAAKGKTAAKPAPKPEPRTGERGRWLQVDAAERILARESARVEFTVERVKGDGYEDYTVEYACTFLEAAQEWLLTYDVKGDGSGESGTDYRLSRDLFHCPCKANMYSPTGEPCKHRRLLARALAKIGIEPTTGQRVTKAGAA